MKILIIGGTRFVGRYLVKAALKNNHQVTLFNRGKSNARLFPQVEKIKGDRDGDLKKLGKRKWDAVIDTCGYFPRIVNDSAVYLKDKVDRYIFVSTVSVYKSHAKAGINERSPLGTIKDKTIEEITSESYGPLKVLCEKAVQKQFPKRNLIIRPGLIVGPHDLSDRFTYWVDRMARGGKMLLPKPKNYSVQYIDVRDLADWIIDLMERDVGGIFNAIGPKEIMTFEKFIEIGTAALNGKTESVWVDQKFLKKNEVQEWRELPIYITEKEYAGLTRTSCKKAFANGLKFRAPAETIKDTYDWCRRRPKNYKWKAGLDPKREKALIKKWLSRS